ncbi:MAG: phenylalanine--tRNA ligase subunit beta, partial [bacterium]|nr:phenylalanine--tRNA ligase subunit beta [bacterium]
MKISLKWLREYVDVDWTVAEFVERLTMAGLEAESVENLGAALSGIIVGKVIEREQHPSADRLSVCRVDVGEVEPRTIVCGAPNVAAGQTVAVVLPGSQLPDGTQIGKAKLRGVASEGMICSTVELGLGDDSSGIMVLPDDWSAGAGFAVAAGLDDTVIDFEVTPNRPDCLSVVGIAREVAALAEVELRLPAIQLSPSGASAESVASVTIEDPQGCGRYVARVIRGVHVGPSPAWLQDRLRAVGQRPINNVVDVTNFVMLELGQPLHAFDLDRLQESRIVVRRSRPGETVQTLDGAQHELTDDGILLIADGRSPVAIAGVMGAANSLVTEQTTDILLESAYFDARQIRAGARRLGMHTDASTRFERGTDWDMPETASRRAAALLADVAGGQVAPGAIDVHPLARERQTVPLRPLRAARLLALPLDATICGGILQRLGCVVADGPDGTLSVTVPSFRPDLEREIDLVEEVGRIYGYLRVPASERLCGPLPGFASGYYDEQRRLRQAMMGLGLDEAITSSIVADAWAERTGPVGCRLANAPAGGVSCMRTSLLPGLLDVARRNLHQRAPGVALFEVGRVFLAGEESADDASAGTRHHERCRVAGVLAGHNSLSPWRSEQRAGDFLDLKGVVEGLLSGVAGVVYAPVETPLLRRGHAARVTIGDRDLGLLGQAHPELAASFDLTHDTFIFELSCDELFSAWASRATAYQALARFPPIERDLAVVLDEQV